MQSCTLFSYYSFITYYNMDSFSLIQLQYVPTTLAVLLLAFSLMLFLTTSSPSKDSVEVRLANLGHSAGKHSWEKSNKKGIYYCNVCKKVMAGWLGSFQQCHKCGLLVHSLCKLKKKPRCKFLATHTISEKKVHQWREGNIPNNSICQVCKHLCSVLLGCDGMSCLWCQKAVHFQCKQKFKQQCDFGQLKRWVIQPGQVKGYNFEQLRKKRLQSENQQSGEQSIASVINVGKDKSPVIVVINRRSGGQVGHSFLSTFYRFLNPIQVISIPDQSLQRLKEFFLIQGIRIVVGGGDGTISTVANYLKDVCQQLKLAQPPIGIIPLGTGNDLSRSLGWGFNYQQFEIVDFLQKIGKAQEQKIDRWKVIIKSPDSQLTKQFWMYNYLGIGLDAKFCLDFHQLRQSYPQLFFSQFSNKFIYSQMGTLDFIKQKLSQTKDDLGKLISLQVDGKGADLAQIENVVVLNIPSWGGGVRPWKKNENFTQSSYSDKTLQVFGVENVAHLGQVQLQLDDVDQLAQGHKIKIEMRAKRQTFVHIDGEPFRLHGPFIIQIEWADKVLMLRCVREKVSQMSLRVQRRLEECIRQGLVGEQSGKQIKRRILQLFNRNQ